MNTPLRGENPYDLLESGDLGKTALTGVESDRANRFRNTRHKVARALSFGPPQRASPRLQRKQPEFDKAASDEQVDSEYRRPKKSSRHVKANMSITEKIDTFFVALTEIAIAKDLTGIQGEIVALNKDRSDLCKKLKDVVIAHNSDEVKKQAHQVEIDKYQALQHKLVEKVSILESELEEACSASKRLKETVLSDLTHKQECARIAPQPVAAEMAATPLLLQNAPNIPKFSGTMGESGKTHYELIKIQYEDLNFSAEQLCGILKRSLTETAEMWMRTLLRKKPNITSAEFIKAFEDQYSTGYSIQDTKEKLSKTVMKEGESLQQFWNRVNYLHTKIDKNVKWQDVADSVKLKALPRFRATLILHSFNSEEEFAEYCKKVDRANEHITEAQKEQIMMIKTVEDQKNRAFQDDMDRRANGSDMREMVNEIRAMRTDFGSRRGQGGNRGGFSRGGNNSKSNVTCYTCQKPGHMSKDCYSNPKNQRGRGSGGSGRGRNNPRGGQRNDNSGRNGNGNKNTTPGERRCHNCNSPSHLKRDCTFSQSFGQSGN
jgi:Zinc knuckle